MLLFGDARCSAAGGGQHWDLDFFQPPADRVFPTVKTEIIIYNMNILNIILYIS